MGNFKLFTSAGLKIAASTLILGLALPVQLSAQTCPAPPTWDVLIFLDNSGSITSTEFDQAQQAVAGIAQTILGATPGATGNRLAVVNWGCTGSTYTTPGCRTDLATNAPANGWSTDAADFSYAGLNSTANKVCRSFGQDGVVNDRCGGGTFASGAGGTGISNDYAQDALRILDGQLYGAGGTGGNNGYNAPGAPVGSISGSTSRLMIIHMTDALSNHPTSRIKESLAGDYFYSNQFKNPGPGGHNAIIVGVGIDGTSSILMARDQLGAFASKGGGGTDYDTSGHAASVNVQPFDLGTPRLTEFSATYNAATIIAATNAAFAATDAACVILRKGSSGGTGSFDFGSGTNGLPSSLTITTTATANPQSVPGVNLSQFNTDTSITEAIPTNWKLSSVSCTDALGAPVSTTSNLSTGLLTIAGSAIISGAEITCTFNNTLPQANLSIAKTNTPGSGPLDQSNDTLSPAATTTYTIVATNNGTDPMTGATIMDPAGSRMGLTCTTPPTCTGSACPAGPFTVASLDSPGITLGTLAAGASVTVSLTCTVQ